MGSPEWTGVWGGSYLNSRITLSLVPPPPTSALPLAMSAIAYLVAGLASGQLDASLSFADLATAWKEAVALAA